MANEVKVKSRSSVTVQASAAITAGSYNSSTPTVLSRASSGNADGCWDADIYIDVDAAPSGAATAEIWMAASPDNTNYSAKEYCLSVAVPVTVTGYYHMGTVALPMYSKLYLKAVTYGFTASLIAIPLCSSAISYAVFTQVSAFSQARISPPFRTPGEGHSPIPFSSCSS